MSSVKRKADIVIMTALPEEFRAVKSRLQNVSPHAPRQSDPRLYGWTTGELPSAGGAYQVVLGRAAHAGQTSSALATQATISRWQPQFVFFVGIAAGFAKQGVDLGEIAISDAIWGYEYGKAGRAFHPRHDLTYRSDSALLTAVTDYADDIWPEVVMSFPPPLRPTAAVRWHVGPIASGDKVVDDPNSSFFSSVLRAWPKIIAVEMEGAGAAAAASEATAAMGSTRFLMVRGISDVPDADRADSIGTQARDTWKPIAAGRAAAFLCGFVRSGLPLPPRPMFLNIPKSARPERQRTSNPTTRAVVRASEFLVNVQLPDGGIPATKPRQTAGCWTTASSLESLVLAANIAEIPTASLDKMCEFLIRHQLPNGGWPLVDGATASTMATGHAVAALLEHQRLFTELSFENERTNAIENGFAWLVERKLPGGGWGIAPESGSDGEEFRLVSTFYGLRPFLTRGYKHQSSAVVQEAALAIGELQGTSGGWQFISGRNRREEVCPSNTARALILLIRSGLRTPKDASIAKGLDSLLRTKYGQSWRLSIEGFFEASAPAQGIYHNNTPCDALLALRVANAAPSDREVVIQWLIAGQRDDGAWPLQSPDTSQTFYDPLTWPTAEFIYSLIAT